MRSFLFYEVQSGFGERKVFAQPFHNIKPDIICMAKGMGNGFPIGGILFLILSFGLLELLVVVIWLVPQVSPY
jgi:acetylornithine/succinyldiaminopimelate/putrescine aminotransferase